MRIFSLKANVSSCNSRPWLLTTAASTAILAAALILPSIATTLASSSTTPASTPVSTPVSITLATSSANLTPLLVGNTDGAHNSEIQLSAATDALRTSATNTNIGLAPTAITRNSKTGAVAGDGRHAEIAAIAQSSNARSWDPYAPAFQEYLRSLPESSTSKPQPWSKKRVSMSSIPPTTLSSRGSSAKMTTTTLPGLGQASYPTNPSPVTTTMTTTTVATTELVSDAGGTGGTTTLNKSHSLPTEKGTELAKSTPRASLSKSSKRLSQRQTSYSDISNGVQLDSVTPSKSGSNTSGSNTSNNSAENLGKSRRAKSVRSIKSDRSVAPKESGPSKDSGLSSQPPIISLGPVSSQTDEHQLHNTGMYNVIPPSYIPLDESGTQAPSPASTPKSSRDPTKKLSLFHKDPSAGDSVANTPRSDSLAAALTTTITTTAKGLRHSFKRTSQSSSTVPISKIRVGKKDYIRYINRANNDVLTLSEILNARHFPNMYGNLSEVFKLVEAVLGSIPLLDKQREIARGTSKYAGEAKDILEAFDALQLGVYRTTTTDLIQAQTLFDQLAGDEVIQINPSAYNTNEKFLNFINTVKGFYTNNSMRNGVVSASGALPLFPSDVQDKLNAFHGYIDNNPETLTPSMEEKMAVAMAGINLPPPIRKIVVLVVKHVRKISKIMAKLNRGEAIVSNVDHWYWSYSAPFAALFFAYGPQDPTSEYATCSRNPLSYARYVLYWMFRNPNIAMLLKKA